MTQVFRRAPPGRGDSPAFDAVLIVEGGLFIDELERKPNGGKFPFFGVGCRHSGGHFPADTLHRVPVLETVFKPRACSSLSFGSLKMRWTACVVAHESRGLPL